MYYAATELEARQCAGSPVVVVGGGNSAGQAAIFLADKGSSVAVVIRGAQLGASMSGYLVRRLENHPHIDVLTDSQVVDLEGEEVLQARSRSQDPEVVPAGRATHCSPLSAPTPSPAGSLAVPPSTNTVSSSPTVPWAQRCWREWTECGRRSVVLLSRTRRATPGSLRWATCARGRRSVSPPQSARVRPRSGRSTNISRSPRRPSTLDRRRRSYLVVSSQCVHSMRMVRLSAQCMGCARTGWRGSR